MVRSIYIIISVSFLFIFQSHAREFSIVEASIDDIHQEITKGSLTCRNLVEKSLQRIDDLDSKGPELNSMIAVNYDAIQQAEELDRRFKDEGLVGPLHCITISVKDNIDTSFMPTTGGALKNSQPLENAFIIKKILDVGAIVIGKANLHEFAFGYVGLSLLGGQPRNVYDLNRGPGGSSSGTATSVSASLAVLGIGTDTGGSVRIPASVQGLVGLRPSLRVISQQGIIPLAPFQDTAGPLCRKVEDCALFYEVMVGYDESQWSGQRTKIYHDSPLISSESEYKSTVGDQNFSSKLDKSALNGARIGVVKDLFGDFSTEENKKVQAVMKNALDKMAALGAVVEEVEIVDLNGILNNFVSVPRWEFVSSLTQYLQSWPSDHDSHPRSFEEVFDSKMYHPSSQETFDFYWDKGKDPLSDSEYVKNLHDRPDFVRSRVLAALQNSPGKPFDVLVYPSLMSLASELGAAPAAGLANRVSPFSGFPSLTFPVG